jgi:cyclic beta-1,2-glucan synthetase
MTPSSRSIVLPPLDPPLRGESFSAEHLWQHAQDVAQRQTIARRGAGDRQFIDRFESNARFIATTYQAVIESVREQQTISPDAEWLVDNYYVVQEQLREVREDLPRSFYVELPKLSSTPFTGFPRVYELAHELVLHTDSSLDEELIAGFIASYQQVASLTSGEIWAVPIMLRLVLVENLRRLCGHMLVSRACRDRALKLLKAWHEGTDAPALTAEDPQHATVIMELVECLRGDSASEYGVGMHELVDRLNQPQEILDDLLRQEQQRLAGNQVSIGNLITSMRLISALDWTQFFERVSLVEQVLRRDPAGVYAEMDFATRDEYRHVIEHLAKRAGHDETHVAAAALDLALRAQSRDHREWRETHIGYFLIDRGRVELERELGFQPRLKERIVRAVRRRPNLVYLGSIAAITALAVAALAGGVLSFGGARWIAAVLAALAVIPASELAVGIVNFLITITIRPQILPKLDFAKQIPPDHQTLVVMPTMLTSEQTVKSLLERLEIQYLANPEPGLNFALLTDYADAPRASQSDDERLLELAQAGIDALNERHPGDGMQRFYLLHRRRLWNADAELWMGWERKRGKLFELNRLLRGASDTSFLVDNVIRDQLHSIRFVITLDSDTRLPHAAARKLVGTLGHPLNRPHYDSSVHRVTRGYGVLQPRVSVSLASAGRSLYARIFSNGGGLDPYCTAVSDVYQDLYGDANFTGKGIYDVDAFAAAVADAFPENHILSHDLIEGCFARVGAVTDVELFDEYPTRFDADIRRQHRWVRGDWQLLPWLRSFVPMVQGSRINPLPLESRWKVFDNLRRSLVPLAFVVFWVAGWFLLPGVAWLPTAFATVVLASPFLFHAISALRSWPAADTWRQHIGDLLTSLGRTLLQCILSLAFLPVRAYSYTDAIARTLDRLFVSRRNLLEWETADATERRLKQQRWASVISMLWIPVASLAVAFLLPPANRIWAAPVLALWFLSPWIAHVLSKPTVKSAESLSTADQAALRRIARRTWAFFEAFVGEEDNWLPPDNYQEFPQPKIAHRISPTNEGMFVLSAVAARDFGFVGMFDLVSLLERNLDNWESLDRYRGHPFNWYDTTTRIPLQPRYVSTADNGNLAASFLAAQQGLIDVVDAPLFSAALAEGVVDSVRMAEESLARLQPRGARFVSPELDALESRFAALRKVAAARPDDLVGRFDWADELHAEAARLPELLDGVKKSLGLRAAEFSTKLNLLSKHIDGIYRDAEAFIPWLKTIAADDHAATAGPNWRAAWDELVTSLGETLSLNQICALPKRLAPQFAKLQAIIASGEFRAEAAHSAQSGLDALIADVETSAEMASLCRERFRWVGQRYETIALEMDFTLLYNAQRRLFSVGFNLEDGRLDRAHYDLLASEARIASQVAIAKGDADHRHWFQLGRAVTEPVPGSRGLLSWGGTMFEYLMPALLSQYVDGSLLERSCETAVARQIAYGKQRRVPWGISESAFAAFGANSDYHYQSFGVPGMGLKRGLGKDLVISPYSTALALAVRPVEAVANFRVLANEGAEGPWGFYDAVDYTPDRVPEGERRVVVFNYMTHHQGMSMVALANALLDHRVQRRFQRQPLIRSTDLLLQERTPLAVLQFQPQDDATTTVPPMPVMPGPVSRRISTPATATPRAHLLSNGQYHLMLTNAGGGYSTCRDLAITRWRSDVTRDDWGQFIYLRDLATDRAWSATHQPTRVAADTYEVTYSVDKAEFRRRDGNLESHLEVTISPECNVEVRQITITNHGRRPANVELTSYAEVVLAGAGGDVAHPAFNKLFVETEFVPECNALIARRRPRDATSEPAYAVHVLAAPPAALERLEFETDRARFLGRGRSTANPAAMDAGAKLSGTTGCVLDAVFSLRARVNLAPDESSSVAFVTGYAESREEALHLADQYHDLRVVQRTYEMAWARSQVEMRHLHASPISLQLYQRLVSPLLFPDSALRAPAESISANRRGQSSLWRHGISGDDPIVLLRVSDPSHRGLLRELLLAHEFWHVHGLKVDLVVVNDNPAGYFDNFQEQLLELIHTTGRLPMFKSGGVYLLRTSQLTPEDNALLLAVASIYLNGNQGTLARQVETATSTRDSEPPALRPTQSAMPEPRSKRDAAPADESPREFAGRYGGFDRRGNFTILLAPGDSTPLPWSNVIANPRFGCLVTEAGGGYTWAGNSRENKLTSWSNDPITDPPSEIVYLRDEETGKFWTPTPQPVRDDAEYHVEHGRGYSRFQHTATGIESELMLSIAPNACVKFACLKLRNTSPQPRTISATYYAEWVLGVNRQGTQMHVRTARDEASGALLAFNSYHEDFPQQTAALHVLGGADSVTGDRREFIGRNRHESDPMAMQRAGLSGATGAGLDACGAVQKRIRIEPGKEVEIIFLVGWTDGTASIVDLLSSFDTPEKVHQAIDQTLEFWHETSTAIEIHTPNHALDTLVNHWLLYQTLSCRVWGRSAFYQSGGAFGFRDQLQDVMALVYSLPHVARQMILQAASRQFEQGDVQHWWHPPAGRGVRTRFADDYLWLPFVVSHYVATTGDSEILDERVTYLHSMPLEPHEHERYELPAVSSLSEDLFGHCLRAIDHAFRFGVHGLPLMGGGDWNDGMNRVGVAGQGESVWLGWFLHVVLERFAPLIEARGDTARAAAYRDHAARLLQAIEREAWDGAWYRRAFFDDGTPLGSHNNDECKIDSLAQSWSVIAGGNPERSAIAMRSAEKHLVLHDERLVLLLKPPFDKTKLDPGYIKGYPPGIRENGGQYTHASMWMIQALAKQGHGDRAVELFDLLNPILAATAPNGDEVYRGEPYVVAADVYGTRPHVGRAGWTWYTGSAAWMYRVAVESILGFELRGDLLAINPCIPAGWPEFEIVFRRAETTWHIRVLNPHGVERGISSIQLDGEPIAGDSFPIVEDNSEHQVVISVLPARSSNSAPGTRTAKVVEKPPGR